MDDGGIRQRTLRQETGCSGVGVHTGEVCGLRLLPAEPDTGIRFYRADRVPGEPLSSGLQQVIETRNRVALARDGIRVETVEHLLAALFARGIDNCGVFVDGPEVPALDGSALPLLELIEEAGSLIQDAHREETALLRAPVWVDEGDRFVVALPADHFRLSATIHFPHPAIGSQSLSLELSGGRFKRELAPARTFGFLADREALRQEGLALGGSAETSLIYGPEGPLNGPLRFADECVRHKMLDFIGDLALLGRRVRAHFILYKNGHTLDLHFLRKLEAGLRDGFPEAGRADDRELAGLCSRAGL